MVTEPALILPGSRCVSQQSVEGEKATRRDGLTANGSQVLRALAAGTEAWEQAAAFRVSALSLGGRGTLASCLLESRFPHLQ